MNKNIGILAVFILTIFFSNKLQSQTIKLGVGGGLTFVTSPAAYTNDILKGGSGFSTEYHYGIRGKWDVPFAPIKPVIFINYYKFTGQQTYSTAEYKASTDIFSAGVKPEIPVFDNEFHPYMSLCLSYNMFGKYKKEKITNNIDSSYTYPGYNRLGLGIGIGGYVDAIPLIDIDASLNYNFLNVYGKSADEAGVSILSLDVTVFFRTF